MEFFVAGLKEVLKLEGVLVFERASLRLVEIPLQGPPSSQPIRIGKVLSVSPRVSKLGTRVKENLYRMLTVVIAIRMNILKNRIDLIPSRNCVSSGAVVCEFNIFAKDKPSPMSLELSIFETSTAWMRGTTINPRAPNSTPTIASQDCIDSLPPTQTGELAEKPSG